MKLRTNTDKQKVKQMDELMNWNHFFDKSQCEVSFLFRKTQDTKNKTNIHKNKQTNKQSNNSQTGCIVGKS